MEGKVGGVVDGSVETAHRLLTSALLPLPSGQSRARGAVVLANVIRGPQEEVPDLTGTPADDEGDDQQEEHLYGLGVDKQGLGGWRESKETNSKH